MYNKYTVFPVYKVEFKGLTGVLKKIFGILGLCLWELLMSLPHWTPGRIYLTGFWILRQDFRAHHVISKYSHREPLPHSLHTGELPFYWHNNAYNEKKVREKQPKEENWPIRKVSELIE